MSTSDLTPEQYEMLFGGPPPLATNSAPADDPRTGAATAGLTFAQVEPTIRSRPHFGRGIADLVRRHRVDAVIITVLVLGAVVALVLS